ncbi:hypothetical protein AGLY_005040 [Aphis glycines]|uniref:Uncharacterized protein n=1 Tax=Aphis glycines TaxID=307491 RepID=A0A6G0TVL5_APHGL|nr:hypothetical protein AGLY_005040 [Aphis glycines]
MINFVHLYNKTKGHHNVKIGRGSCYTKFKSIKLKYCTQLILLIRISTFFQAKERSEKCKRFYHILNLTNQIMSSLFNNIKTFQLPIFRRQHFNVLLQIISPMLLLSYYTEHLKNLYEKKIHIYFYLKNIKYGVKWSQLVLLIIYFLIHVILKCSYVHIIIKTDNQYSGTKRRKKAGFIINILFFFENDGSKNFICMDLSIMFPPFSLTLQHSIDFFLFLLRKTNCIWFFFFV